MADYFKQFLDDGRMPLGKYRGMKIVDICNVDRSYVEWLYNNNTNQELRNILREELAKPFIYKHKPKCPLPHIGVIGQFVKFTGRCSFISRPISNKRGDCYCIVTIEDEFGYSVSTTAAHYAYFTKGQMYNIVGRVTKHINYKGKNQTFIGNVIVEKLP